MKVSELVKFRSDLFFDGAVQLLWADKNRDRAADAARTFVFHGPKYHGISKEAGTDEAYRLTDTATLLADLVGRISKGSSSSEPPFSLAISGYGSGKSHFAVALTYLLRDKKSIVSKDVQKNLASADSAAAKELATALAKIEKPALVVALDGTGNFNLGNALSSALFQSLKEAGLDDSPLRELSPRFDDAANFVKRNYASRLAEFKSRFGTRSEEEIISGLKARNEDDYSSVDEIYLHANGAHIPMEGRESAQDLIGTFCDTYCGRKGAFSKLVVIFDEFGRFLEYVAERPALAGDSALQQIFQGIQDNGERAHFIGFIQYELKAYLARLGQREAMHIQKYITRFDVSKKYYLSSNLETIIAHLLEKANIQYVENALEKNSSEFHILHELMNSLLPGFGKIPIWKDFAEFERVIVRGCWPLHPLATWFLTRQQDIVQSRSAITFVKNAFDSISKKEAISKSQLLSISASQVVANEMLNEMLAAERAHGGAAVDNLIAALSKYEAQLEESDRHLLVAVTAAKKMRVTSTDRVEYDRLLGAFAGLSFDQYQPLLRRLELDLGVLSWSSELRQYELITDAATRGQYQKELRKKLASVSRTNVNELFVGRVKAWTDDLFQDVATPFGQKKEIPTLEWSFAAQLATELTVVPEIKIAFSDWLQASRPDQAKGRILFTYLDSEVDIAEIHEKVDRSIKSELKNSACTHAPIWVVLIADLAGRIQEYIATLYVLEDGFEAKDKDRYSRFIPEARESALQGLRSVLREAIQNRTSIYSGVEIASSRLSVDAMSIFEQVYSRAFPFPFDGLGSKTGNGSADAAMVARALFGHEVSGAWLDIQLVRLQNRVRTLLGGAWGVLDPQGKVKAIPGNAALKELLDTLEKSHKKFPKRSLGDDLKMLLRPPYGFNLASAAILLGLFVGRTTPPRAINYESDGIGLQDWLRIAFGTKGKFLDEEALAKTTIAFLTEDAVSRWQLILQEWESERTLIGILVRRDNAVEKRQRDPVPESLEANFNYLRDKSKNAQEELGQHQQLLEDCETRLEQALQRQQVSELFAVADRLLKKGSEMNTIKEKWTDDQIKEVTDNVSELREVVVSAAPEWIRLQTCNSQQQVGDYRTKMERAERTLTNIGAVELAKMLRAQMVSMISSVEQRFRYKMALDEAGDLIRLPEPVPSSRIREVRDSIEHAERLMSRLATARNDIGETPDLIRLLESLRKRQDLLRKFVKGRQAECSKYLDLIPSSTEEVNDVSAHIADFKHQFAATPDSEDLDRRSRSALQLGIAYRQLDEIEVDPESMSGRLRAVIDSFPQEAPGDQSEENDEEARLDVSWMNQSFESYIQTRVAATTSRSTVWAKVAIEDLGGLLTQHERLLRDNTLARYEKVPEFLSKDDRNTVSEKLNVVRELRIRLLEKERLEKSKTWLQEMGSQIKNPEALSREMCGLLLEKLEKRPQFIGETEFSRISDLRASVERRLDEFDFSDLVNRISKLTDAKRNALFKELAVSYGLRFSA